MYNRPVTNDLKKRILDDRGLVQAIVGPRQVGKTTAIQGILKELSIPSHYAAADMPAPPDTSWIARQWDIARSIGAQGRGILVLDEIQKVAHWSVEVKRLWDEDKRCGRSVSVVLLGSSSLLIQKGLDESLAGRFELIRFPHWSWPEMRDCFGMTLDEFLFWGGYPGAAVMRDDENRWAQYVKDSLIETAISKDILLLNRVEKPVLLRQLFVLACEYGAQIVSYQKITGQLRDAGNTTTLANYQRLLEGAFLIAGVPKWSGNILRRRNSSPKWVPLNTALMTALSGRSRAQWADPVLKGRLVETAVGAHLFNTAPQKGFELFYWREGNFEVDYVLRKGGTVLGIEVKSGGAGRPLSGLGAFAKKFTGAKTMVVGDGGIALATFLEKPVETYMG